MEQKTQFADLEEQSDGQGGEEREIKSPATKCKVEECVNGQQNGEGEKNYLYDKAEFQQLTGFPKGYMNADNNHRSLWLHTHRVTALPLIQLCTR